VKTVSTAGFHVLVALAEGPKHGYAMMRDIEAMTGSRPGPGTLYANIARLEERRLIEPLASDDARRPYQLTRNGRLVLREQVAVRQTVTGLAGRLVDLWYLSAPMLALRPYMHVLTVLMWANLVLEASVRTKRLRRVRTSGLKRRSAGA
jgi:DNA-binding PadR family transcriptional regulator